MEILKLKPFRLILLISLASGIMAQNQSADPKPTFERPSYESPLPVLLELGTYHAHISNGIGYWRGADASIWIRNNPRFTPVFMFNSQTRPEGTQQNYGFFSYYNWSKSFYTTQGFSVTPFVEQNRPLLFPRQRYDVKAHYKTAFNKKLVLTSGFTYFDFRNSAKGQIYSAGFLYYPTKMVIEGNYNVNHNQPGDHLSSSANLSAQYGREGKYWFGATVGGGKEVYSYVARTPLEINVAGYSAQVFFRKWLTRHTGFMLGVEHQNKLGLYTRIGGYGRVFFEF